MDDGRECKKNHGDEHHGGHREVLRSGKRAQNEVASRSYRSLSPGTSPAYHQKGVDMELPKVFWTSRGIVTIREANGYESRELQIVTKLPLTFCCFSHRVASLADDAQRREYRRTSQCD